MKMFNENKNEGNVKKLQVVSSSRFGDAYEAQEVFLDCLKNKDAYNGGIQDSPEGTNKICYASAKVKEGTLYLVGRGFNYQVLLEPKEDAQNKLEM